MKKEKKILPMFIFSVIFIVIYLVFRQNAVFSQWVVRHISTPYRTFVGRILSPIPFSVMELLCTVAVLLVIFHIIRTIIKTKQSKCKLKTLGRCVLSLLLVVSMVYNWYCWSYGFDYFTPGFADENGLKLDYITVDQLYATTQYFADNASRLAPLMTRDENGSFYTDEDELFQSSLGIYANLEQEFPALAYHSNMPKRMFYSRTFSIMGFTGIYFPLTGESNINIDFPATSRPFTIAHELAHSRGVASEDEANFVGVAACLSSGDPVYEYSGYLSGLTYLLNTLYSADQIKWRSIYENLDKNVLFDMYENSAYWNDAESTVTTAVSTVYDGYLKSNGQTLGIRSYSACVELLVAYYCVGE